MLTQTERQRMYERAVEQLRSESPRDHAEALRALRTARCASCHDRDSDPVYDGHGGMVCDICGEDWKGEVR